MKTKIYCKNKDCPFYHCVEKHLLKRGLIKQFDSDIYEGECNADRILIKAFVYETQTAKWIVPKCEQSYIENGTLPGVFCESNCSWNANGQCTRNEIGVDKDCNGVWTCRNYSDSAFKGHIDFSRFPQGGHLSEHDAKIEEAEKNKTKSYRTHLRQRL